MFCPDCETEYRPGFSTCADCGIALVDSLVDGVPSADLLPLIHNPSADLIGTIVEKLEEERIPYVIQAGTALRLFDDPSEATMRDPEPWEGRIWVVAAFLPQAQTIVDDVRQQLAADVSSVPVPPLLR